MDSSGCARSGRADRSCRARAFAVPLRLRRTGHGPGPGRAECSRPRPDAPESGPASTRPATGSDRSRAGSIFACERRRSNPLSRRRSLGSDAASCAVRDGLLAVPATPTNSFGVAVTRARRPATPRASASLTVLARAGCAACRACAQTRSARGDGAGLRLPAPSFHARERVRSQGLLGGWSPVRAVSRAPSLAAALCEAVHRRKPCCLPSLSRLRCVWRRTRRDRPAGQQDYVGERALTASFHPSLEWCGTPVGVAPRRTSSAEGAPRAPRGQSP